MTKKLYVIYLLLLSSVLSIYMKNGYYQLGEAKAKCYMGLSVIFAVPLIICALTENKKEKIKDKINVSDRAEFFLLAMLFSCLVSFAFSIDKETAFWGYKGWRNGLLTSLSVILYAHIYKRKIELKRGVVFCILLVPFFEFVLSIMNRMGIYPLEIEGRNQSFVATLGNINWFSGYLSVWVPLGIAIMFRKKNELKVDILCGIYVLAGLMALLMQGSDGAILIIVGTYAVLLWIAIGNVKKFKRFLLLLFILGMSMSAVDIITSIFSGYYSYEANLLIKICDSHIGQIIVAVSTFLFFFVRLCEEIKVEVKEDVLKKIYLTVLVSGLVLTTIFVFVNFDDNFGNGRGIILRLCLSVFMGLSPWQKIVGIGQDCLYSYALSVPEWNTSFTNIFGQNALTNAHCELLAVLIDRGFIGAVTYLGLFGCIIYRFINLKEKESILIVYGLPIISYLIYNQVSFAQVTSTPYAFILIGLFLANQEQES